MKNSKDLLHRVWLIVSDASEIKKQNKTKTDCKLLGSLKDAADWQLQEENFTGEVGSASSWSVLMSDKT